MVPKDLFYKMAALALVAIILACLLSLHAFALDVEYMDSGHPPQLGVWEGEFPGSFWGFELPESEQYRDSGDPLEAEAGALLEEVTQIRKMLELILCFIFPFILALWLVYKFCMWFYYTFIRTVL